MYLWWLCRVRQSAYFLTSDFVLSFVSFLNSVPANTQWWLIMRRAALKSSQWRAETWCSSSRRGMTGSGEKTASTCCWLGEVKHARVYSSTAVIALLCVLWPRRFVRNLSTSKEGWIAAANLITLIGKSKSCQSLTSSGIPTNRPKLSANR